MGFVPSEAEETPLDWYPEHIEQHLRENVNVENWILVMMRARLRARSTVAARGQGTPLIALLPGRRPGVCVIAMRPACAHAHAEHTFKSIRYIFRELRNRLNYSPAI